MSSLTERILSSAKTQETILDRVSSAIEESNLNSQEKVELGILANIESFQKIFYTTWDWVSFADYEGIDIAIESKHFETVIENLVKHLNLEAVANNLSKLKNRFNSFKESFGTIDHIEQHVEFSNNLKNDVEYLEYESKWESDRAQVENGLIQFVKSNIEHFPR